MGKRAWIVLLAAVPSLLASGRADALPPGGTAAGVVVSLPGAPPASVTRGVTPAAPSPLDVLATQLAGTSTILHGEAAARAAAVKQQLATAGASVRVPLEGVESLHRVLHRHGVLTSVDGDPGVPVVRCEPGLPPAARAACWIDALVWTQQLLVDGAGLGARSQALPPHRKRLSRKEKAEQQEDEQRRAQRAITQVTTAAVSSDPAAILAERWLHDAGPGRWATYTRLVEGLQRYRALAKTALPALPEGFPVATKWAHRRSKERRAWLRALTPAHREALRERLCAERYCAPTPAEPAELATAQTEVPNRKRAKRRSRKKTPAIPLDVALTQRLRAWQDHRGLRPSGLVDKPTLAQLRVPMGARVQQIRLALQRIRDTEIGASDSFLIANIPAFRLDVWRDHKLHVSHLTQVGKGTKRVRRRVRGRKRWMWVPGMRTPMISSKLRYMVVNPEWVVPSSIRREYRWKIRSDDNWLADNGFEMRKASNGGDYMVMKPGPQNLLGQVKFLFPNTHLVYLHDTPKQRGFKYPVRLRSHGCVRVARAFDLARDLLTHDQGKRWTEKKWLDFLEKSADKWVRLRTPLDLHIAYWTADVSPDGHVRFYRDFYKYDAGDLQRVVDVARALLPEQGPKQLPAGPSRPSSPGNGR